MVDDLVVDGKSVGKAGMQRSFDIRCIHDLCSQLTILLLVLFSCLSVIFFHEYENERRDIGSLMKVHVNTHGVFELLNEVG